MASPSSLSKLSLPVLLPLSSQARVSLLNWTLSDGQQ
jgi:hypothetical protein